jgi:hypothetical protein
MDGRREEAPEEVRLEIPGISSGDKFVPTRFVLWTT